MGFRTRLNAAIDRTGIRPDEDQEFADRLRTAIARSGRPSPKDVATGVGGFMSGVYKNVADIAGAVPYAAESVARAAGKAVEPAMEAITGKKMGPRFIQDEGKGHQRAVRDFFEATGLTNPDHGQRPSTMERAGYNLIPSAAQLLPIGRGAAAIEAGLKTATRAPGLFKRVISSIGKEINARPGLTLATEAGANVGAEAGSNIGPPWAVPGAVAGGSAAALTTGLAQRSIAGTVGMFSTRAPARSLLSGVRNPDGLQAYAGTQLGQDIARSENRIVELASRGLTRGNADKAEAGFRRSLDGLRNEARDRMGTYAQAIPDAPVPLQGAYQRVGTLITNLRRSGSDTAIPDRRVLQRFFNNLSGQQGQQVDDILADTFEDYTPAARTPLEASRDKVLDFIRELRQARHAIERGDFAQGGPAIKEQSRQMRGTYREMEEALWGALEQANPGSTAVSDFRAYSKWYFDTFERGPLADLYAKPAGTVAAAETLQHILKQHGGSETLQQLSTSGNLPVPNTRRTLPRQVNPALEAEAQDVLDNYIRDTFRGTPGDIQAKGGAVMRLLNQLVGNRGFDDPTRSVTELKRVTAEFLGLRDKLGSALSRDAAIRQSALAQYANNKTGLERLWQGSEQEALGVLNQFQRPGALQSSEARDAFKMEVIYSLLSRNGRSQSGSVFDFILGDVLSSGHKHRVQRVVADALTERSQLILGKVLAPDELARFNRILKTADSIARGDERFVLRKTLALPVLFGRVVGASVGRNLPLGGGTIQVPGAFARLGARFMDEAFRGTPTDVLMQLAIFDPKWEKLLMRRLPRDTKEARALARQMRRLISISVGAETYAREELDQGQEFGP